MSNGNDDSQPSRIPTLERLRQNLFGDWKFSRAGSSRTDSSEAGSSRAPVSSPSITSGPLNGSQRSPATPLTETSDIGARLHEEEHHEDDQHEDDHLEGNQYVYVNSDEENGGCMYNQRTDGLVKKKTVEAAMLERLKEDTSKRKKKNRRKGKEDGPALGTYTGGTIPFSENYNRLAAKKRAHISVEEVIVHSKKKKHDGQTWVDSSDVDLWARFIALRDEAIKNGLDVTDDEIWYSLVHDRNVKDRMSGVGDYERKMRKLKPSSTHRRSSSSAIKKSEIEILKEQNKRLQEQRDRFITIALIFGE
ncbi:unnamed protein product [Cuscuta campestris]|uniref:Uncharacterized protein n=1 Tax=Cuscuta campestris TaxID=132261 RepID=A0A484M2L1_9ASTE|nr:unnamed protein product [Cuscuta campestris]